MHKKALLAIALFSTFALHAQLKGMFRNIIYDIKQEKSLFVSLDGKTSVIKDVPIKLFGLQVGYLFNKRTNVYLGFYASYNDEKVISNPTAKPGLTDTNTIWQSYKMSYLNIGCEYYFYDARKWRLSIPFGIGSGSGLASSRMMKGELNRFRNSITPLELGFNANYKLCWWMWIGAGMGTRLSLSSSRFNGAYYSFGVSLKTGEIYRRVRTNIRGY